MNIKVYELKIKLYILKDIPVDDMLSIESDYIDSALALSDEWLTYHENTGYKMYTYNGLYPLERSGIYKKDSIYTMTIRTVKYELASYMSKVLANHYTETLKGLIVEKRIISKRFIEEIYTLTPAIQKNDIGYWKDNYSVEQYEQRLFINAVKKYNAFTNSKLDEDFDLYTSIQFLNKKPVKFRYKGITLLGDKFDLKIADNKKAQELAYFLIGTGISEMNSRGAGYCNYKYI